MQNFKSKLFQEVPGGEYDPYGFYYTPNGSFWDPDGVYFNAEGYDAHGGYYDEKLEYVPGPGWIPELLCYEDEKDQVLNSIKFGGQYPPLGHLAEVDREDELDEEGDIDEIYEEIDYEKLMREEERKMNSNLAGDSANTNKDVESIEAGNHQQSQRVHAPRKAYNPRDVAQAHMNNMKNLANDVNNLNVKYESEKTNNINKNDSSQNKKNDFVNNEAKENKPLEADKEKPIITADMLFNKIPENLKPKNTEDKSAINSNGGENIIKKETKIEVDSLFD